MTTSGTTVTTTVVVPSGLRVAHIRVTAPPTAVPAGGFAIPLPAGFSMIRFAAAMQVGGAGTALVAQFNPQTQKCQLFCSNGASPALLNEFTGDASTRPFDLLCFDWDESGAVSVIAGA